VEGAGGDVIKGAWNTIRSKRPTIFFAIHNDEEREAVSALEQSGYTITTIDGEDRAITGEVIATPN
jgi:hypothetical protein